MLDKEDISTAKEIAKVLRESKVDELVVAGNLITVLLAEREQQRPSQSDMTWVGLTLEERDHLWEVSRAGLPRYNTFAGLVESKLREKNT
jgi:Icc-related predicted phosphoesterase